MLPYSWSGCHVLRLRKGCLASMEGMLDLPLFIFLWSQFLQWQEHQECVSLFWPSTIYASISSCTQECYWFLAPSLKSFKTISLWLWLDFELIHVSDEPNFTKMTCKFLVWETRTRDIFPVNICLLHHYRFRSRAFGRLLWVKYLSLSQTVLKLDHITVLCVLRWLPESRPW